PVVRDATRWLREEPSRPRMTALGRSLQIGDPEGELPTIAVPAEDVDACIDTLEAAEAHLAAIRAYRSQAQDAALAPGSLAGQSTAASPNGAASQTSPAGDRKSTRLNSSHVSISYAVFCLKKKIQ